MRSYERVQGRKDRGWSYRSFLIPARRAVFRTASAGFILTERHLYILEDNYDGTYNELYAFSLNGYRIWRRYTYYIGNTSQLSVCAVLLQEQHL